MKAEPMINRSQNLKRRKSAGLPGCRRQRKNCERIKGQSPSTTAFTSIRVQHLDFDAAVLFAPFLVIVRRLGPGIAVTHSGEAFSVNSLW